MESTKLNADRRYETGKGYARRLRAAGKTPAILYGSKTEPVSLQVDTFEFGKCLDKGGSNLIFDLVVTGEDKSFNKKAMLKEKQTNPVDGAILHLDFIEVFDNIQVEVTVPLELIGKAQGVDKGGVLESAVRHVTVSCLPSDIPESIQVDISELKIGQSVFIKDVATLENVTVLNDPEQNIASVVLPKRAAEEVEEETEEAEAAEETAEAAETES